MATAVSEKKSVSPSASGSGSPAAPSVGAWTVHKPGEGTLTRLGSFGMAGAFGLYSAHHWYYGWTFLRNLGLRMLDAIGLGVLLDWSRSPGGVQLVGTGGAVLVFGLMLLAAYHVIYCRPRTAEFLVQTDGELRKVTWPNITPWFKPETQVWGITYVILIVTFALTVYIFLVDYVLNLVTHWMFYQP
ncbi:MAG: hypothetical protein AMXMBFR7_45270 [Planctomycetota bacterium]